MIMARSEIVKRLCAAHFTGEHYCFNQQYNKLHVYKQKKSISININHTGIK